MPEDHSHQLMLEMSEPDANVTPEMPCFWMIKVKFIITTKQHTETVHIHFKWTGCPECGKDTRSYQYSLNQSFSLKKQSVTPITSVHTYATFPYSWDFFPGQLFILSEISCCALPLPAKLSHKSILSHNRPVCIPTMKLTGDSCVAVVAGRGPGQCENQSGSRDGLVWETERDLECVPNCRTAAMEKLRTANWD